MKRTLSVAACLIVVCLPMAHADKQQEQAQRPCVNVEVQNDRVNRSFVQQDCYRNLNRTVQAGADNTAQTIQRGAINNHKTRQYQYDQSRYLDRVRGD